jgi:CRISPR-associated protein Csb2
VLLWAPAGFDAEAQLAIRAVRHEVAKKSKRPHRVVVAALGERRDILELHSGSTPALTQRLHLLLGSPTGSTEWVSVTPFVPPRFLKSSGRNSLEGQIRTELAARDRPEHVTIEVLETNHGNDLDRDLARRGRHFVRRRSKGGNPPPIDCGFMVRLRFSEPIPGPIVLGYGCHFGMGAFEGVPSTAGSVEPLALLSEAPSRDPRD